VVPPSGHITALSGNQEASGNQKIVSHTLPPKKRRTRRSNARQLQGGKGAFAAVSAPVLVKQAVEEPRRCKFGNSLFTGKPPYLVPMLVK